MVLMAIMYLHVLCTFVVLKRDISDLTKLSLIIGQGLLDKLFVLSSETLSGVFCQSFCQSQEVNM